MSIKPYYQKDDITIYHGDCLEILPQLDKVDLVLTDPPYGINMSKGFGGFDGFGGGGRPIHRRKYDDNWDCSKPSKNHFDVILNKSDKAMIFGGNFFADNLPVGTHWIVWDKLNTMPSFGDCELIWTNIDRKSIKKITHQYNGLIGKESFRSHPTQKPLELIKKILNDYSKSEELILDPFMGSGTTLRAAKDLNRKAIGIEIEEKYCEIAVKRLSQEVLQFS